MDKISTSEWPVRGPSVRRFSLCLLIFCLCGAMNLRAFEAQEQRTDEILKTNPDTERAHERAKTRTSEKADRNAQREFQGRSTTSHHRSAKKPSTHVATKFEDSENTTSKPWKGAGAEGNAKGSHKDSNDDGNHAQPQPPPHGCESAGSLAEVKKCKNARKEFQGKK